MYDEEAILATVNLCWNVACRAALHGTPMVVGTCEGITPGVPNTVLDTVRLGTYQTLLNSLLPKGISTFQNIKEKEPWQE